jgi:hypothetical protein
MQSRFENPRSRNGFLPRFYPKANGQNAPPADATERNDRIVLECLAAYYDLNSHYSRLLETRKNPESPERSKAERKCLHAIEKTLILRDSLEDRYAPLGVIAEPVVEAGFTVDVKFSFGNVNAAGRLRSRPFVSSAFISIPLPPGVRIEDLTFPNGKAATEEHGE